MVTYYRSGPIERDPALAFHAKNRLDDILTEEFGFKIIGDTFEHLEANNCPQAVYGADMKKLRNQGRFFEYRQNELLLIMSLKSVRRADFVVVRPSPEASGGTTSETVMAWLRGVPKLVIIGPHGEGIFDNNSTFMIRMLTDYYSLVFNSEKEVAGFIKKHMKAFKNGRNSIRQMIARIKIDNPHVNDRPKPLWDGNFEGKTILLQGKPGCGKDTQGRLLQDLCGFKFFGSGYELRRLSSKFPILGKSLDKGNLAPEIIINYLMTAHLIKLERFEPIVFSGAAKKLGEAAALTDLLCFLNRKLQVIVLDIDDDLFLQRIVTRRNCNTCETSFLGEKFTDNPTCPVCDGQLYFRPENTSDQAIDKILSWYKTDVEKVIRYFENLGLVIHLNGNRTKEEIFKDILEILKR